MAEQKQGSTRSKSSNKRRRPLSEALKKHARSTYQRAILDAAHREFARVGYHETKMADVAREAGVSVGTLYNHFESKEIMLLSLVGQTNDAFLRTLDEGPTLDDSIDRLHRLLLRIFEQTDKNNTLVLIYTQFGRSIEAQIASKGGPGFDDRAAILGKRFEAVLRDAVDARQIRADLGIDAMVTTLMGTIYAYLSGWNRGEHARPARDRADEVLALFLGGAAERGAGEGPRRGHGKR